MADSSARKRLISHGCMTIALLGALSVGLLPDSPAHAAKKKPAKASVARIVPLPVARPSAIALTGSGDERASPNAHAASSGAAGGTGLHYFQLAVKAIEADNPAQAERHAAQLRDPAQREAVEWLLAVDAPKHFGSERLLTYLGENSEWPEADKIRRRLEGSFYAGRGKPEDALRYFEAYPPLSTAGEIGRAAALKAAGQAEAAAAEARRLWREASLSDGEEQRLLALFEDDLTRADHKRRMDLMLYRDRTKSAMRAAGFLSTGEKALAAARIAADEKRSNALGLIAKLAPEQARDPGALFARMRVLRRAGRTLDAALLAASAPKSADALVSPEAWWEERRVLSRELLEEGLPHLAYTVVKSHLAREREAASDAEFHAGWIALLHMNAPEKALPHFLAVADIATSPISNARALYWIARAHEGKGDEAAARQAFAAAAQFPYTYYGQLAAEQIGQNPNLRAVLVQPDRDAIPEAPRRALDLFERIGRRELAIRLAVSLGRSLEEPAAVAALSERVRLLGDPFQAIRIAKRTVYRKNVFLAEAFPTDVLPNDGQNEAGVEPALVHAIVRQESEFKVNAGSPVGAQGLMQLMPGTARDMAKATGQPYDKGRLMSDAAYNVSLGSAYLAKRIDGLQGSYIMAAAAYNAGIGRVLEWKGRFGDPRRDHVDPIDWIERIPFTETRNYVQRVMENLMVYRQLLPASTAAMDMGRSAVRGNM